MNVVLDERLSFVHHIPYFCEYATRMMGFLYSNTANFTNIDCLLTLYYACVRSKLEYYCVIRDPFYTVLIDVTERIQRKSCKHLFDIIHGYYPTRSYPNNTLKPEFDLITVKKGGFHVTAPRFYFHAIL